MGLRKYFAPVFMVVLVFALACGRGKEVPEENQPAQSAAAAPVSADAATLSGIVKFEGTPPKMPPVKMGGDPYCESEHPTAVADEEVIVGPGGELANVLVYVKNPPAGSYAPPSTHAVLDQKGCRYSPHVSAVQVGQPVDIRNSDATLHNVHAMAEVNDAFNVGQPVQGMISTKKFDKVELKPFRIKCDVHGWMKAYMAVLPHPFHSVSQTNGTFTIANLPPGNYTLVAWHEKYGQQEQQVTVGPKEQKQVTFTFKG